MRSALPPTCRQASACPNSCVRTIKNNARYSRTFQLIDEYRPNGLWIIYTAARNHHQCRNTSTPKSRNRWIDPLRVGMRLSSLLDRGISGSSEGRGKEFLTADVSSAGGVPLGWIAEGGIPYVRAE